MRNCIIITLMLTCLGLAGCGEGDVKTADPATTTTNSNSAEGAITISLTEAPAAKNTEKTVAALPIPTNLRICIFNAAGTYSTYRDLTIPAAATTISVPAGTGYSVYAVSYTKSEQINCGLKNGRVDSVTIVAGATTPINLTLQAPNVFNITLPSSVVSQSNYSLAVPSLPNMIDPSFMVRQSSTPITDVVPINPRNYFNPGTYPANPPYASIKAPLVLAAGNLYLQYIFTDMVAERQGFYVVYNYPNPAAGDPQMSVPITLPTGGVSLGITY